MNRAVFTGVAPFVLAAALGLWALVPSSQAVRTDPTSSSNFPEELVVVDPYDLIFDEIRLRRKNITVHASVKCLDPILCRLDLSTHFGVYIEVRFPDAGADIAQAQANIHRLSDSDCPLLITGYFDKGFILVDHYRPDCSEDRSVTSQNDHQDQQSEAPTL